MSAYLTHLGWSVYTLNLTPNFGTLTLEELAQQLNQFIEQTFEPDQPIDLVGLSMGGLVSRYYVQRLGGINRVQRFITIASPHNGTLMAYSLQGKGCIQMRPSSPFLTALNQDIAVLSQLNFTSIWTPWDFIIVPATSSQVPVGEDVIVPVIAHAMMARHPHSLNAVATALAAPLKSHLPPEHTHSGQKSLQFGNNI